MASSLTLTDLDGDILALICDAFDCEANDTVGCLHDTRFTRPSLKALSMSCKSLRAAAAPTLFYTLAIWDWNSFVETARAIKQSELALRHTKTLRVTPVLARSHTAPEAYSLSDVHHDDLYLPKTGGGTRTNQRLRWNPHADGTPIPGTVYKPLARVEGGSQTSVTTEAEALRDLLLQFNNLTTLVFGLGADAAFRPPFERAIVHAFGGARLTTVRKLDIEDTGLFWADICDRADDMTVYLGYRPGIPQWPSLPTVRKLTLHHTKVCHPGDLRFLEPPNPGTNDEHLNCGPAITKSMPGLKSLDLVDCWRGFQAVLASLAGFKHLEDLHVHNEIRNLNIGLDDPESGPSAPICGGHSDSDEEEEIETEEMKAALAEHQKRWVDKMNADAERAMKNAKRIVLAHFPQLQRVRLGKTVCYDFSMLSAGRTTEEVEMLRPSPMVEPRELW